MKHGKLYWGEITNNGERNQDAKIVKDTPEQEKNYNNFFKAQIRIHFVLADIGLNDRPMCLVFVLFSGRKSPEKYWIR